jgi:hypothetical protein
MSKINLRVQNNRDVLYVHVADEDFDIVKGKDFGYHQVGQMLYLTANQPGGKFSLRYGQEYPRPPGYANVWRSSMYHDWVPLFGPYEIDAVLWPNQIVIPLPPACHLPWPSERCIKYIDDTASCARLLNERAMTAYKNGLRQLKIPDHMVEYIGYDRLAAFLSLNPWLSLEREKQKEAA